MNSFRMFKARGQPGCWYGYVDIDGVTYKIDARHVGERVNKHFEGTVKRHVKADQTKLPLKGGAGIAQRVERTAGGKPPAAGNLSHGGRVVGANPSAGFDSEFNDSPEDI